MEADKEKEIEECETTDKGTLFKIHQVTKKVHLDFFG